MIAEYPVTLDGKAPSMDVRVAFSDKFQRKLYERWLKAQMKLREQHVLGKFSISMAFLNYSSIDGLFAVWFFYHST